MSALRRSPGDDRPYQALADGTRRELLELLAAAGPLRAGDIAQRFPRISRPAVSRHLRVLREAGFVEAERPVSPAGTPPTDTDGRELWYRARPEPLAEVERWMARYRAYWSSALDDLARLAETPRKN
jgi:DNA-binding transcriptional ArsR family regulator